MSVLRTNGPLVLKSIRFSKSMDSPTNSHQKLYRDILMVERIRNLSFSTVLSETFHKTIYSKTTHSARVFAQIYMTSVHAV